MVLFYVKISHDIDMTVVFMLTLLCNFVGKFCRTFGSFCVFQPAENEVPPVSYRPYEMDM